MPLNIGKYKEFLKKKYLTLYLGCAIVQKSEEEKESRVSTLTSAQQASQVYNYGMTGIVSIYPVL